jgi:N-acetylglucosaminyl-diphospho-decaprenol L-rhamnosyltransferase
VIAAVVVTYQPVAGMLDDCVRSLVAAGGCDLIVVVDNGGSAVIADDLIDAVELLRPGRNGGFGAGANQGFRYCLDRGATAIALLNDDLQCDSDWLAPLVAELGADPQVGAVQPKLLLADSGQPRINSVGVALDENAAGSDIAYGEPDDGDVSAIDIDLFTGGAVLFSASFLKRTNGFDERFFLYYEDVDLGLRGARAGFRYRCARASRVRHRVSASTSLLGDHVVYLRERNRLWCAFRHQSFATVGRAVWLSLRRVRHRPRRAHVRAVVVGVGVGATRFLASRCLDVRRSR